MRFRDARSHFESRVLVAAVVLALIAPAIPASAVPSTALTPDQALGNVKYELGQLWYAVYGGISGYRDPRYIAWFSHDYGQEYLNSCSSTTATQVLGFYCSNADDERLYLDWDIARQIDSAYGDYAYAGIIAHEWGHHIQNLLGWPYTYRNQGYYANFELHADCLSGIWARWAFTRGIINADDVTSIRQFYWYYLGDAGIWIQSDTYNDRGAHGTREQRYAWFNWGYNQYNLSSCAQVFG